MKILIKFACIYCGQHLECEPRFSGRQILCPACLHRIVIPRGQGGQPPAQLGLLPGTWDTHVEVPKLEIPTRYRNGRVVADGVAQVSQPAVSQCFQPADVSDSNARSDFGRAADWKSAIQQTGSLRYDLAARRSGALGDFVNGPDPLGASPTPALA